MSLNEEQPTPKATDRRPVWPMVIEYVKANYADEETSELKTVSKLVQDMQERDEIGRKKYGVPLTSGNGRDSMVDAFQELLDFVVYTRTWLDEQGIQPLQPGIAMKSGSPAQPHTGALTDIERLMARLFEAATEALLQMRGAIDFRAIEGKS